MAMNPPDNQRFNDPNFEPSRNKRADPYEPPFFPDDKVRMKGTPGCPVMTVIGTHPINQLVKVVWLDANFHPVDYAFPASMLEKVP